MGNEWQPIDGFSDLVFTGMTGKPRQVCDIQSVLNKVVAEINADEIALAEKEHRQSIVMEHIHPHALRHTAATNMHQLTGDFYPVGASLTCL